MPLRFFSLVVLVFFMCACVEEEYPGFSVSESNVYYQLHATDGEGRKAVENDLLTLNTNYFSPTNEVLYRSALDSRNGRMMVKMPAQEVRVEGGFYEALANLNEGDSATLLIKAELFYSDFLQQSIPATLNREDRIRIELRLEKIRNQEEVWADDQLELELRNRAEMQEQVELPKLVAALGMDSSNYHQGIYIKVLDSGNGEALPVGELVWLHYSGSFASGEVFDDTRQRGAPIEYMVGTPDIILPGLMLGVSKLSTGGRARIIIPSQLAFGDQGSKGVVPAFTTVIYDIELIKPE